MAAGARSSPRRIARPRLSPPRIVRDGVSTDDFARAAKVALVALTLIVLSGAAVRLTGSGLGCPDWPKCYGQAIAPLETHAVIEYGNRVLSALVGVIVLGVSGLVFLRRPLRRDLVLLGLTLPLGVVAQAVLGGYTVRERLAPGFVMAHFCLSMLIVVAAAALYWRALHPPGWRAPAAERAAVWAVRGLLPLGAVVIFAGTAATAAGPHAGGMSGQRIKRLTFEGAGTLDWAIHQHARIALVLGVAAAAAWWLLRRRDAQPAARRTLTVALGLLAAQGVVGTTQYLLHLPGELVWVHVGLASALWLALVWATAQAGRRGPRRAPAPAAIATRAPAAPAARSRTAA
jgi:cytochrome c oxidase assembly protein subunit 15